MARGDLTDEEWAVIGELLPSERRRKARPARQLDVDLLLTHARQRDMDWCNVAEDRYRVEARRELPKAVFFRGSCPDGPRDRGKFDGETVDAGSSAAPIAPRLTGHGDSDHQPSAADEPLANAIMALKNRRERVKQSEIGRRESEQSNVGLGLARHQLVSLVVGLDLVRCQDVRDAIEVGLAGRWTR